MVWRVTAPGTNTGKEYSYTVDAPADAEPVDVASAAFREHGNRYRAGDATEHLGLPWKAEPITD